MEEDIETVHSKHRNALCIGYWHTERDEFDKDLGCRIYGRGLRKLYRIYKYSFSGYEKDMPTDIYLSYGYETEKEAWAAAAGRV